jgi:hypothetical protein
VAVVHNAALLVQYAALVQDGGKEFRFFHAPLACVFPIVLRQTVSLPVRAAHPDLDAGDAHLVHPLRLREVSPGPLTVFDRDPVRLRCCCPDLMVRLVQVLLGSDAKNAHQDQHCACRPLDRLHLLAREQDGVAAPQHRSVASQKCLLNYPGRGLRDLDRDRGKLANAAARHRAEPQACVSLRQSDVLSVERLAHPFPLARWIPRALVPCSVCLLHLVPAQAGPQLTVESQRPACRGFLPEVPTLSGHPRDLLPAIR